MTPKAFLTGISSLSQAIAPLRDRRLMPLLLGLLAPVLLSACDGPAFFGNSSSRPVKLTAQAQESLQQQLDELLSDRIPATGPGAAVLVTYNNKILYAQGHGLSNVEQKEPITTETVFDLASVSKSMTALAILQLQERGDLTLADPVSNHLPDFKDPNPDDPVLISHLLYHTSGLVDYIDAWDLENEAEALQEFDLQQLLPWLSQQEPQAQSGTEFDYSDTGYALLALIVQQVSGQPFPEFMADQIFDPTGMTQTRLYQTLGETFPQQAQGYQTENNQPKAVSYPVLMLGDGNIFTTIADLARYDQALRQGKLVSDETLDAVFQNGTFGDDSPIGNQQDEGYGAGWSLTEDYGHHRGGWAGMSSYYRFYTQRPLSIVVLANNESLNSQDLGEAIAEVISAQLE